MTIRTIILAIAFLIPTSAGAQTVSPVDCLAVVDAIGDRVGRAFFEDDLTQVVFEAQGVIFAAEVFSENFNWEGLLYSASSDCSDPIMIQEENIPSRKDTPAVGVGSVVYFADTSAASQNLPVLSNLNQSGACTPSTGTRDVFPTLQASLPAFTPPFHVEPEPCFTPDPPDPEQFIHGCIKGNGTLKIVTDPTDCTSRETPISWLGE